jgi:hypothetical protein
MVRPPWLTTAIAPSRILLSRKPKSRGEGGIRDRHRRLCGAENTEREKLSDREKSAREIPSRRGEIVAIVIIIALDFIGIIIISSSTFISTIPKPSRCNILG